MKPLHLAPPLEVETVNERPRGAQDDRPTQDPGATLDVENVGDFELLSLLGQGSGGRVFLARERSLNRTVALKVVSDAGAEANTLAQLEHEHIVRVFSESTEPETGQRLICMQYVPGTTLGKVLQKLRESGEDPTGPAVLNAIDALSAGQAAIDPAQMRERSALERADAIGAVCFIGAAIARALAHAHRRGVVHRDVKPQNILLTPYGRPMLVDFNISSSPTRQADSRFGVTMTYAAPEQLLAFAERASKDSVGPPADLYSLGLVLFQLVARTSAFAPPENQMSVEAQYAARTGPLRRLDRPEPSSRVLERVLRRCLALDPAQRYADADELASALDACAALRDCEKELPVAGPLTRFAQRRPMTTVFLAGILPNILGSMMNFAYVAANVVDALDAEQLAAYHRGELIFILTLYPAVTAVMAALVWSVARTVRTAETNTDHGSAAVAARQQVLALPGLTSAVSLSAWMLSLPYFPWFIFRSTGRMPWHMTAHSTVFVGLAGLLACMCTSILVRHATLRLVLPWLTADGRDLAAPQNLASLPLRLRAMQLAVGAALPTAVVVVLAFSSGSSEPGARALLGVLMWLSAIGATATTYSASEASRCAEALERLHRRVAK
jgi:serine/threonine protein kinase